MRRSFLSALLLLLVLVLSVVTWYTLQFFFLPITLEDKPHVLVVPPGTTLAQVAHELHKEGILSDVHYFLLLAKWRGYLTQLKKGEYLIEPGATPYGLLSKLVRGDVILHRITFPEGWTFHQMLHAMQVEPTLIHTFQILDPEIVAAQLKLPVNNPEGLFYPSTYFFGLNTTDLDVLRMAYKLGEKKLQKAWLKRSLDVPYKTPYEALIVASLVEKETASKLERPLIAGVILKRLQINMPLQIDASVIYGLGKNYKGKLSHADVRTDTPYNTYTRRGLPPTPIAMPSDSSLEAALHPQITNALFYVSKGDGSHVFSENFQDHRAAIHQYLNFNNIFLASLSGRCVFAPLMLRYWIFEAWGNVWCPTSWMRPL